MKPLDFIKEHVFGDFQKEQVFNSLKVLEISRQEIKIFFIAFALVNILMLCLGTVLGFTYANTRCMVFYSNNRIAENCFLSRTLEEQNLFSFQPFMDNKTNKTLTLFKGPRNFTFLIPNLTVKTLNIT